MPVLTKYLLISVRMNEASFKKPKVYKTNNFTKLVLNLHPIVFVLHFPALNGQVTFLIDNKLEKQTSFLGQVFIAVPIPILNLVLDVSWQCLNSTDVFC